MSNYDYMTLSKLFTRNMISKVILEGEIDFYQSCVMQFLDSNAVNNKTNEEVLSELYSILRKNYRNEYFYKNTVLNKLLLGKHSLQTTVGLSEIPIYKSKADFILINGSAIVYEIKSDIDSLERLGSQIEDYYKGFSCVYVVTSEASYEKIEESNLNKNVGVLVLNNRKQLSPRREATIDYSRLDHQTMFNILRKKEYENIIIKHHKHLPEVPQVKYYRECLRMIKELDCQVFYKDMISELKKRNIDNKTEFKEVPYELKYLLYFSNLRRTEYIKLNDFLKQKYGG